MTTVKAPPHPAESAFQAANQSVAQSTAMALADATDNLRNLNTLSTTAIGTAFSQLLETGDPKYLNIIDQAQKVVTNGAENFGVVGEKVATVLNDHA
ncbi:RebB family R body protein [Vibrio mexicanus]|uniref:RebB family R body protein n=1 Tax=Vibrio mexicanus TaxID=1004326 RepID=UPI00063C5902|nr:RebB family R body protein [Vibrio mexicanus]